MIEANDRNKVAPIAMIGLIVIGAVVAFVNYAGWFQPMSATLQTFWATSRQLPLSEYVNLSLKQPDYLEVKINEFGADLSISSQYFRLDEDKMISIVDGTEMFAGDSLEEKLEGYIQTRFGGDDIRVSVGSARLRDGDPMLPATIEFDADLPFTPKMLGLDEDEDETLSEIDMQIPYRYDIQIVQKEDRFVFFIYAYRRLGDEPSSPSFRLLKRVMDSAVLSIN